VPFSLFKTAHYRAFVELARNSISRAGLYISSRECGPKLRYNHAMRRCLSIAALTLILLALPLWAQRGGRVGGSHATSHGGFSGHSSGGFHSGGGFHGGGGFVAGGGSRNHTSRSYYTYRASNRGRGSYPYLGYYPWGYYGAYDGPLAYDAQNSDGDQDAYAAYQPPAYPDNDGLKGDVQALSGKIDRLQADVQARNQPKSEQEPETALVFRDQHVEEVRNYAISGGMLWVLNQQTAKKIPLAQLDIAATVKMNDDRGVDFQVPEPMLQIMIVR
jgi:uncharacterized membrane protein YgcG